MALPAAPIALKLKEGRLRTDNETVAIYDLISVSKEERLAFKCKCSDNKVYSFNPVFGILDPGDSTKLTIVRSAAPGKVDTLVIEVAPVPPEETNAESVFHATGTYRKANFKLDERS